MKVYYFSELPYHEYPNDEGEKYASLRLTFPNSHFDPQTANGLFKRYVVTALPPADASHDDGNGEFPISAALIYT